MLLTEEQAFHKDCPQAKNMYVGHQGAEMGYGSCSGTGCAAWRWWDLPGEYKEPGTRRGYCGMGGMPPNDDAPARVK